MRKVNPGGPDNSQTISPIDKSLSRNRHRVWSLTHGLAIKEESKVVSRDC